jgi:hypothetical protein
MMVVLTVGTLLGLALVTPTLAGGWAVTTMDSVPEDLIAGKTYELGYTVRQHGDKPVDGMDTSIVIRPADGSTAAMVFQGTPDGQPGHYVAQVTFPTSGDWSWEVNQGQFGAYAMGTLSVAEASASGVTLSAVLQIALPALTLVMIALFAAQLALVLRGRKTAQPAPAPVVGRPGAGD